MTRVAAGSFVFGACVAALRVLGMAGFSNDHFYYLSRAEQVLHGAWPVRDFIDPGIPLAWGLSVMGQIVGGHTLLSEAVLVAIAFGLSAGLTAWVVARWTGVAWLGFWAAFVQLAILPRSYSYPKILAYVLAAAAFTRYARAASDRALALLAAVIAVAFFFRHDHGVYVAVGACILVAGYGDGTDAGRALTARRFTSLARLAGFTALMVAPYLIYVAAAGGLTQYLADGLQFSEREADRTLLGFPGLGDATLWSPDGLSVVGYYAFWITPIVAALVAWTYKADRWVVTAIAGMTIVMNPGLLRDPLTSRVPDTIVPFTLLSAWLFSQLWRLPSPGAARVLSRTVTCVLVVVVAAAAATIGDFEQTLERAELLHRPPRPGVRWRDVSAQLREPYAERQMPSDLAFALVPFFQYVQRCTAADARILVAGSIPELSYYARRGFAGGQPALDGVYYSSPELQTRIVAQLQRENVPLMVAAPDGIERLTGTYPGVMAYVKDRFVPMADVAVEGSERPARVFVNRDLMAAATDRDTGWPCFVN